MCKNLSHLPGCDKKFFPAVVGFLYKKGRGTYDYAGFFLCAAGAARSAAVGIGPQSSHSGPGGAVHTVRILPERR